MILLILGASDNVYSREDVIETLLKRYDDLNYIDIWEAKDFDVLKINQDNYLITYVLIQYEDKVTRRSTIWRKQDDSWVIIYHQGTVLEVNNEEPINHYLFNRKARCW